MPADPLRPTVGVGHDGDVASTMSDPAVIDTAALDQLIRALSNRGYRVVGPTLRDNAIVLAEIDGVADLPHGWGVDVAPGSYRVRQRSDRAAFGHSAGPGSWKQFLHPARQRVWSSDHVDDAAAPQYAFLGVRSCDLAAIGVLDRVFVGGRHRDGDYAARRDGVFIVAVNCTEPGGLCFCASTATGPRCGPGYDLVLTERCDGDSPTYLVQAGSPQGAELLASLAHQSAAPAECAAADRDIAAASHAMGRSMPDLDLRRLLVDSRESAHWEQVANRCLTCGNCTMVCPTCFCTSTSDVTDLSGTHAERWTQWASCFELDFTFVHEGPVRKSAASRYRHWLTHKLSSWHDQFGTSGCVGCGRCIAWCPTGIDITEEMATFARERDGA